MIKKPTNTIDDIFRDSIENMETPPSESFWIKTSEEALFKSNLADKKAIGKWKLVAAALAIVLVSLSEYVIYMQREIGKLSNKVNVINKEIVSGPVTRANITIDKRVEASNDITIVNKENSDKTEIHSAFSNIPKRNSLNSSEGYISRARSKKGTSVVMNHKVKKHFGRNSHINNINKVIVTPDNDLIATSSGKNTDNNRTGNYSNKEVTLKGISNLYLPMANTAEVPIMDNMFTITEDSPSKKQSLLSRLSVSLFYEPYITDELFENDATDITTVNSVVSSEEEAKPYIAGMRVEYKISPHLSILTGCSFYDFKVSVDPTTIFAQKMSNGEISYAFHTSVGTVNCPYSAANAYVGDAIIVKGMYTSNYVSIPVYIKYNFLRNSNWNVYLIGGVNANMVVYRKMDMHWQDSRWDQGDAIEGIAGPSNVYGSLYFSPGISYMLYKGLSIYAEPSLQSAPVFISSAGISKTNSLFTGIGTGIIYQL